MQKKIVKKYAELMHQLKQANGRRWSRWWLWYWLGSL